MTVWTEFEPPLGTIDVRQNMLYLAVVGTTDTGPEIDAHLAKQPRGASTSERFTLLHAAGNEGSGTANHPMDAARRRLVRTPHGVLRSDVGAARARACVMRRDRTHDRYQHRRTTGPALHQRTGGPGPHR